MEGYLGEKTSAGRLTWLWTTSLTQRGERKRLRGLETACGNELVCGRTQGKTVCVPSESPLTQRQGFQWAMDGPIRLTDVSNCFLGVCSFLNTVITATRAEGVGRLKKKKKMLSFTKTNPDTATVKGPVCKSPHQSWTLDMAKWPGGSHRHLLAGWPRDPLTEASCARVGLGAALRAGGLCHTRLMEALVTPAPAQRGIRMEWLPPNRRSNGVLLTPFPAFDDTLGRSRSFLY